MIGLATTTGAVTAVNINVAFPEYDIEGDRYIKKRAKVKFEIACRHGMDVDMETTVSYTIRHLDILFMLSKYGDIYCVRKL